MLIISAFNIVGGSHISTLLILINININNVYRSFDGPFVSLGLKPCHLKKPPFFQCGNISRRGLAVEITFILVFFCFIEDILLILPISIFLPSIFLQPYHFIQPSVVKCIFICEIISITKICSRVVFVRFLKNVFFDFPITIRFAFSSL